MYRFTQYILKIVENGVGQGCTFSNDCNLSLLCLNHSCKCNESYSWNGTSCKPAISCKYADSHFTTMLYSSIKNAYKKRKKPNSVQPFT